MINKLGLSGYRVMEANDENVVYLERGAAEYERLRKGFNKRIDKYPRVIALCKNTSGVVEAFRYAKANGLRIAIKSGGHCVEGFSSIDGGIVINLSLLNDLAWIDNYTIRIGPACTLKKIYESIIPKKKYLQGGSCQSVAIGGLTLGGGYGLTSRTFGLTCDSLIEATMVTPEGKVISTKDDPELLWALKGGGNGNFGAVTEMKFRVHDAPSCMRSYKFRNKDTDIVGAKELCKDWFEMSRSLPNNCFSAFIFNGKSTYILLTDIGKNSPVDFIDHFKAKCKIFTQGKKLPLGQALKAYYAEDAPIMFKNASAGLYKSYDQIESVIENVFTLVKQKPGMMYQVNTLGGRIQSPDLEKSSAFAHRDCIYFSELQSYWSSPSAASGFIKQFELIQQQFANAGVKAQYRNYADINFKDWAKMYYGKNLDRLLAVKRKYDPGRILDYGQTL